jgi:ribosomal protein L16/L10AE
MLLFPKNSSSLKVHGRKTILSTLTKSNIIHLGDISIVSAEGGYITSKQLESIRVLLRRKLKKQAKI